MVEWLEVVLTLQQFGVHPLRETTFSSLRISMETSEWLFERLNIESHKEISGSLSIQSYS